MSTRSEFFREAFIAAAGIGVVIVASEALGLWWFGAFSWIWFARLVLIAAGIALALVLLILLRNARRQKMYFSVNGPRRIDHTQGWTLAFLIGAVAVGLFVCGGLLEWLFEFQ